MKRLCGAALLLVVALVGCADAGGSSSRPSRRGGPSRTEHYKQKSGKSSGGGSGSKSKSKGKSEGKAENKKMKEKEKGHKKPPKTPAPVPGPGPQPEEECVVGWVKGEQAECFRGMRNCERTSAAGELGWTNVVARGVEVLDIVGGAQECSGAHGFKAGEVGLEVDQEMVALTIDIEDGWTVEEASMWIGRSKLPQKSYGRYTASPAHFPYKTSRAGEHKFRFRGGIPSSLHLALHVKVCRVERTGAPTPAPGTVMETAVPATPVTPMPASPVTLPPTPTDMPGATATPAPGATATLAPGAPILTPVPGTPVTMAPAPTAVPQGPATLAPGAPTPTPVPGTPVTMVPAPTPTRTPETTPVPQGPATLAPGTGATPTPGTPATPMPVSPVTLAPAAGTPAPECVEGAVDVGVLEPAGEAGETLVDWGAGVPVEEGMPAWPTATGEGEGEGEGQGVIVGEGQETSLTNIPAGLQRAGTEAYFPTDGRPIESGSRLRVECPESCTDTPCEVVVATYHCPPCSSATNGGLPMLLPEAGWSAGECAPTFKTFMLGNEFGMVAFRKLVPAGTVLETPALAQDLTNVAVFVRRGAADCAAISESGMCAQQGECVWEAVPAAEGSEAGSCVSNWCPAGAETGEGGNGGIGEGVACGECVVSPGQPVPPTPPLPEGGPTGPQ